jgi:hypothetical protein|tara:strand:- start:202 stop:303 length:102 start_codon:yes stop_codon:yes gene_type:complete
MIYLVSWFTLSFVFAFVVAKAFFGFEEKNSGEQ